MLFCINILKILSAKTKFEVTSEILVMVLKFSRSVGFLISSRFLVTRSMASLHQTLVIISSWWADSRPSFRDFVHLI